MSDGVVLSQYEEKKYVLENKLGIEIEAIRQHRQYSRIIEIEFSTGPLEARFDLADTKGFENFTFPIGKTRTETIIGDLTKIPHYLFAGMTGKGKSSFIKTMISVLIANNKNLRIIFIDLKGSEAPLFNAHPRVSIVVDEKEALKQIQAVDKTIAARKELFRGLKVPDIRTYYEKIINAEELPRILVVVDEIAQLTPTLAAENVEEIKKASLLLNKIARLGRSFGVHLAVGVQKPDSRNLDSTIKANAEGVLCFPVQNQIQSRVVLDNNRAMELGGVVGRAVWQTGGDEKIVQTAFLSNERIASLVAKEKSNGKDNEGAVLEFSGGTGNQEGDKKDSAVGAAWSELNQ